MNMKHFSTWRIDLMCLGLVTFAGFLSSLARGDGKDVSEVTAAGLMLKAHEGRVTWRDFPGFRADLCAKVDGETLKGTLAVSASGEIKLDIPSNDRFAWVNGSLKSIISHRLSSEDAIQTVAFADDQANHPLGRLLKSTNESDKSLWRVQGDLMTEVHRFNDKTRFVISVTDVVRNAEGKHLPRDFTVTTWDTATGQIKSSRQVYNEWIRIGAIDLPLKLLAAINKDDGSRHVEQIELSNHELLPASQKTAVSR